MGLDDLGEVGDSPQQEPGLWDLDRQDGSQAFDEAVAWLTGQMPQMRCMMNGSS